MNEKVRIDPAKIPEHVYDRMFWLIYNTIRDEQRREEEDDDV